MGIRETASRITQRVISAGESAINWKAGNYGAAITKGADAIDPRLGEQARNVRSQVDTFTSLGNMFNVGFNSSNPLAMQPT